MADLTKEQVEEFRKLMKEEYEKDLTYKEAYEQVWRLVRYFELLIEIDRREKGR